MKDPMTDLILECYALYQSPTQILKTMKERYGDNAPSYAQILAYRKKHRKKILELREKFEAELPVLNTKERWGYIQTVIDDALEEKVIPTKDGSLRTQRDLKTALQAIKIANEMTEVKGAVIPENEDIIRQIVMETYDELKQAKPKANEEELIEELLKGLGSQAEPYIKEIAGFARMNG